MNDKPSNDAEPPPSEKLAKPESTYPKLEGDGLLDYLRLMGRIVLWQWSREGREEEARDQAKRNLALKEARESVTPKKNPDSSKSSQGTVLW